MKVFEVLLGVLLMVNLFADIYLGKENVYWKNMEACVLLKKNQFLHFVYKKDSDSYLFGFYPIL